MIKIEKDYCKIEGSLYVIREEFRIFLRAIKHYSDKDLLEAMIDVLKEELEKCNEQS